AEHTVLIIGTWQHIRTPGQTQDPGLLLFVQCLNHLKVEAGFVVVECFWLQPQSMLLGKSYQFCFCEGIIFYFLHDVDLSRYKLKIKAPIPGWEMERRYRAQ